ncbi:MAG: YitT family protein [Bacilli bacterium]|nr:YitT family protein [Bacilli bacterium]
MNKVVKKKIKEFLWVTLGVILIALAFSWFLDPYNLVIGGASGLAVIFKNFTSIPSNVFIFGINGILLIIGFIFLGKDFLIKTIYGSLTFPAWVWVLDLLYKQIVKINGTEYLIEPTNMLLITLFAAIIMGFGLGIVVKHGGTTGGTEIAQNILYKLWRTPYSLSLYLIDGVIVLLGFFFIRGNNNEFLFDVLLYEIIFLYLNGVVMDQIIFSGFNRRAVMIISEKSAEIKERILNDFKRGVTEVKVVGGYTGDNKTQLICVLSSNQFSKLKMILNELDPKAFYYVMRANEVGGEGFSYEND